MSLCWFIWLIIIINWESQTFGIGVLAYLMLPQSVISEYVYIEWEPREVFSDTSLWFVLRSSTEFEPHNSIKISRIESAHGDSMTCHVVQCYYAEDVMLRYCLSLTTKIAWYITKDCYCNWYSFQLLLKMLKRWKSWKFENSSRCSGIALYI